MKMQVRYISSLFAALAVALSPALVSCSSSDDNPGPNETVAVTSVAVFPKTLSVAVDATESLTATVQPDNASSKAVVWTSSNSNVATVSDTGVVTGKAAGPAAITAASRSNVNAMDTCTVTVTAAGSVTGVRLDSQEMSVPLGGTGSLTASLEPPNATNQNVVWTSGNPYIADVEGNGLSATVTGKSVGTVLITVRTLDGNKTAVCAVLVVPGR